MSTFDLLRGEKVHYIHSLELVVKDVLWLPCKERTNSGKNSCCLYHHTLTHVSLMNQEVSYCCNHIKKGRGRGYENEPVSGLIQRERESWDD